MAVAAPNPLDVVDFQFKTHSRLKIFKNDTSDQFSSSFNLLAVSSRYGLLFVGTNSNNFKVIQGTDIVPNAKEALKCKSRTIQLCSRPTHLTVNCDSTKLCVITEKNETPIACVYEISSFLTQKEKLVKEIRLSATANVKVLEAEWNPAIPDVFTACKSDGSLGNYEFKQQSVEINELPAVAGATCFCWSPKGKQIAVGSKDGKITQYKPDLKAVKSISPPQGYQSICALKWISNLQFIAVYQILGGETQNSFMVVDAPKTGNPVYTNYEDICYSFTNLRPHQFYLMWPQQWNVLVASSSNSMEVGILGMDGEKWIQWTLEDNSRAELPLSDSKDDVAPVGAAFYVGGLDYTIGEETKKVPLLFLLSDRGDLCSFYAINKRNNAVDITSQPEELPDRSGEAFFVLEDTQRLLPVTKVAIQPVVTQPKPVAAVTLTPKPLYPQTTSSNIANPTIQTSNQPLQFIQTTKPQEVAIKPIATVSQMPQNFTTLPIKSIPVQPIIPPVIQNSPDLVKEPLPEIDSTPTKILERNDETEALIAHLIREECNLLEAELQANLHRGRSIKIDVGGDAEATHITQSILELEEFYKALQENMTTLASEIQGLNQLLIQTWAWYEEARSRYNYSKDPTFQALKKAMPLDPVSQKKLETFSHLTYYLDSQLDQANRCLDEQWDTFQNSLIKSSKLKMPTMESIYQSMDKHNKILQKQMYLMKYIKSRLKSANKTAFGNSLLSIDKIEGLEEQLTKLHLYPTKTRPVQFNKVLERQSKLSESKSKQLLELFKGKDVGHVSIVRPQHNNSTVQLSQLLEAKFSPIASSKKQLPKFAMSTPMPEASAPKGQLFKPKILERAPEERPLIANEVSSAATPLNLFGKPMFAGTSAFVSAATTVSKIGTTASAASISSPVTAKGSQMVPAKSLFSNIAPSASDSSLMTSKNAAEALPKMGLFGNFGIDSKSSSFTPISLQTESEFSFDSSKTSLFGSTIKTDSLASGSGTLVASSTSSNTNFPSLSGGIFTQETSKSSTGILAGSLGVKTSDIGGQSQNIAVTKSVLAAGITPGSSTGSIFGSSGTAVPGSIFGAAPQNVLPSNAAVKVSAEAKAEAKDTKLVAASAAPSTAPLIGSNFGTLSTTTSSTSSFFESVVPTASSGIFKTPAVTTSSLLSALTATAATSVVTTAVATVLKPADCTTATSSIFGGPVTSPIAGTTSGSLFTTPATTSASIFSTTTTASIFGSGTAKTSEGTASGSLFGSAPSTTTTMGASIFGNSAFGAAVTTQASFGATSTTKSLGIVSSVATTTAQSAFGNGSSANTKSAFESTPAISSQSVFGAVGNFTGTTAAVSTSQSVFGSVAGTLGTTPVAVSTSPAVFGTVASSGVTSPATTQSVFGNAPSTNTQSIFGAAPSTTNQSIFGSAPKATQSVFGTVGTVQSTTVQSSPFGSALSSTTQSAFGVPATTSPSVFGSPAVTTQASVFGAATSTAPSVFGSMANTNSFAAPSPFSNFGNPTATTGSAFGSSPFAASTTSNSPFGGGGGFSQTSGFGKPAAFGQGSVFGSTTTTTTTSSFGSTGTAFGAPQNQSPFASANTFGNSNSPFGPATTTTTSFGSSSFGNTSFGQPQQQQQQQPQQQSAFGGASSGFSSISIGSAPQSGFGASPAANPFAKPAEQKSPFAAAATNLFGSPSITSSASIFGGTATSTNTSFGTGAFSKPAFGGTGFGFAQSGSGFGSPQGAGTFSGGGQSVQQSGFGGSPTFQKPTFGGAPAFGSPASFGGSPAFGAAPSFGGSPAFGSPQKVFGAPAVEGAASFGPASPQNATFGNLANQNTLGFGNLAQQAQSPSQPQFGSSPSFTSWRN